MLLVGPRGLRQEPSRGDLGGAAGARSTAARSIDTANLPAAFATGALVVEDLVGSAVSTSAALFHLINLAREEHAFVLITARSAPAAWNIAVPDLVSRLRVLPLVELAAPDDALLRAIIVKLFADRQLAVDEALVAYLAARIERSFAGAQKAVEALDREALRLQRPVTRALAGELFQGALTLSRERQRHVIGRSSSPSIMNCLHPADPSWQTAHKPLF